MKTKPTAKNKKAKKLDSGVRIVVRDSTPVETAMDGLIAACLAFKTPSEHEVDQLLDWAMKCHDQATELKRLIALEQTSMTVRRIEL